MEKNDWVQEIGVTEIPGLRIGNAQDKEAKTGVTVLLFDQGARVGVDISGGGPASRETPLASPVTADNLVHGIVLSGGSAYGLAAADGVMAYLEEHGIGYDTEFAKVPLVCQSCIYDLGCGRADIRPDKAMGYAACVDAEQNIPAWGSIGAGTGATVGKLCGMSRSMKAGLGIYGAAVGELKMAAIVVVNAIGDIFDPKTGQKIAGLRTEDKRGFSDTCEELYRISQQTDLFRRKPSHATEQSATKNEKDSVTLSNPEHSKPSCATKESDPGAFGIPEFRPPIRRQDFHSNTTIGAVVTNGKFSKAEINKIASMARNAYARCINPVGTMADGDTVYAASIGEIAADLNVAGTLAAQVMAEAIIRAVSGGKDGL